MRDGASRHALRLGHLHLGSSCFTAVLVHGLPLRLQDDASLDLSMFRERFGDVPQKSELTLLCPLKEDPTEKVGRCPLSPCPAAGQ